MNAEKLNRPQELTGDHANQAQQRKSRLRKYCREYRIINMHRTLALIILCFGMSILGGLFSSLPAQVSRAEATVCDTNQLPPEIQGRLRTDFGTWKAQSSDNLNQKARLSWAGKKKKSRETHLKLRNRTTDRPCP
jgi:hypothetical protein